MIKANRIIIKGIVQGVGFRPFVYRTAIKYNLKGIVLNDTIGVEIRVEGDNEALTKFIKEVKNNKPPAAQIDKIIIYEIPVKNFSSFSIKPSSEKNKKETFIPPDIATCKECVLELFDNCNRRYRYPFINCTNCGPRYSIVLGLPYDRPNTTMSSFKMCQSCLEEYNNPLDRRFHAQPNACARCGPTLKILDSSGKELQQPDPISFIVQELRKGKIIVLKGLGGFHIVCDASQNDPIIRIRKLKNRKDKPLAVMVPDIECARKFCNISKAVEELLSSPEAPIVLTEKLQKDKPAPSIAPKVKDVGIMLPYTPVHHLILKEFNGPLVMTSANPKDKPIVYKNDDAISYFKERVDFFVLHNRDIYMRIDDSVVKNFGNFFISIRRARGYTPIPIDIGMKSNKTVLALGGMLKSTFSFLRDNKAVISQYLGDLSEADNLKFYIEVMNHLKNLYGFEPNLIVHDLHPTYPTTELADELANTWGIPRTSVQHHMAHIASAMAEHGIYDKFIGVAFDGTGYGLDGNIWGGEIFFGKLPKFNRVAHIDYFPLVTGEMAIKEPWRIAFYFLFKVFGESYIKDKWGKEKLSESTINNFIKIILNMDHVLTSSTGRLLDGISSILGIKDKITYEGQAAIELETICNYKINDFYPASIESDNNLNPYVLIKSVVEDMEKGVSREIISSKVHNTLARWILKIALKTRYEQNINLVVLSGGVFQNRFLLLKSIELLKKNQFKVIFNQKVPINDSGISLGQAVISAIDKRI